MVRCCSRNHKSRLQLAVVAESLKRTSFCIVDEPVKDHPLPSSMGSLQLLRVSENGTGYVGWAEDIERSFHAFALLKDQPEKPEGMLIRIRGQNQDVEDE